MRKLTVTALALLLTLPGFAFASGPNEEVECSICFCQTCEVHHLDAGMVPAFLYATGKKLAEQKVKDWSFECSSKSKEAKVTGHFHFEEKGN